MDQQRMAELHAQIEAITVQLEAITVQLEAIVAELAAFVEGRGRSSNFSETCLGPRGWSRAGRGTFEVRPKGESRRP
jgi:hypothetical protein